MSYIKIELQVSNSQDVIKKEKGFWVGLASRLIKKDTRKEMVEEEVYLKILEELKKEIPLKLKENGIEATTVIKIVEE